MPISATAYRKAVRAFADAGCRYLQLDEVNIAYLCDPKLAQERRPGAATIRRSSPQLYADLINTAMSDMPADMTITMHLCRGNFRSTFMASGGYEPVAEMLFNAHQGARLFHGVRHRARRRVRAAAARAKGKTVVLGLVTSKSGQLESKDELKRRIEEAAKYR